MPKHTAKRIVVYLDQDLRTRLEALAKAQRRSLSNFVEVLCQDAIAEIEREQNNVEKIQKSA